MGNREIELAKRMNEAIVAFGKAAGRSWKEKCENMKVNLGASPVEEEPEGTSVGSTFCRLPCDPRWCEIGEVCESPDKRPGNPNEPAEEETESFGTLLAKLVKVSIKEALAPEEQAESKDDCTEEATETEVKPCVHCEAKQEVVEKLRNALSGGFDFIVAREVVARNGMITPASLLDLKRRIAKVLEETSDIEGQDKQNPEADGSRTMKVDIVNADLKTSELKI